MADRKSFRATPQAPTAPLTLEETARLEAENALRQFDLMVELIEGHTRRGVPFSLAVGTVSDLNRVALEGIEPEAGLYRHEEIEISNSSHVPPPATDVPMYVAGLCDYVNSHPAATPLHLAAYVMWRLNWIHPFVDGNGRTSRAVSYYVLCASAGFLLPGEKVIPDLIAENKQPYYQALEAADTAWTRTGTADVGEMESLLGDLVAKLLADAWTTFTGGKLPSK